MNFQDKLKEKTKQTEEMIMQYLPKEEGFSKTMAEAMNYSMRAGGKRIRPLLLMETCQMFGGDAELAKPFMAAMEMIHTHSLIHDDLPAIDNDDYRRGRLTTHKVFGEAMGVLSGVALLNYAYETMLQAFQFPKESNEMFPDSFEKLAKRNLKTAKALKIMSEKTGIYGMLGGQSVDVENDGKQLEKELLDYIYEHKTSALLEAAMMTGAVLGGASDKEVLVIEKAAKNIGLAFQIQDDILDVTSTDEVLGKPVHSDEKNNKVTYVTLFGIEEASLQVKKLSEEAIELLESLEGKNEFLNELIMYLVNRKK